MQRLSSRSLALTLLVLLGVLLTRSRLAQSADVEPKRPDPPSKNARLRGSLDNSRIRFEKEKKGHVAFIGGSITQMNGYRPMMYKVLQKRFPDTEFTFTDAGISSTCSTTGAFRLQEHVLDKGPVDLFFVEFAVNDDQDAGHAPRECIRGMEGIIRHCRRHNPNMDIIITHFVNEGMVKTIQSDKLPISSGNHEKVASHYGISTNDLAQEVAERITAGKLTWKQFGGCHPAPMGNALCAGMIDQIMEEAWSKPLAKNAKKTPHKMPERPLDENNYEGGHFIDCSKAKIRSGWMLHEPEWKKIPGGFRKQFAGLKLLCADKPGDELTLEFTGKAIGAYVLAGPDAGIVEASVDGGPVKEVNLYHRYSRGLHYPRTVMFDADLEPGKHTLTLKMSGKKSGSKGTAMRILEFVAN